MPRCYLLAVSTASSLDQNTNNYSLFGVVEELQLPNLSAEQIEESRPVLPYQLHVHWEFSDEEMRSSFEFAIETALGGHDPMRSKPTEIPSTSLRHRFRIDGIGVPGAGRGHVRVVWRDVGADEWREEPIMWPFNVTAGEASEEPTLPLDE